MFPYSSASGSPPRSTMPGGILPGAEQFRTARAAMGKSVKEGDWQNWLGSKCFTLSAIQLDQLTIRGSSFFQPAVKVLPPGRGNSRLDGFRALRSLKPAFES